MPLQVLILCLGLFLGFSVGAQNHTPDDLLNLTTYQQNRNTPYSGGTFVYIDIPKNQKPPETFVPTPLQLSGTYPINTPFGQKTEASFVPHTPDFNTIIQILGNGDIIMEQTIQFVNTKKTAYFSRSFSKQDNLEFFMLKAFRENSPVTNMKITETPSVWTVTDNTQLPSGIYTYTISYLIKGALQHQEDKMRLRLSLTGPDWALPVERFSAVILFPNKTTATHALTFGANDISLSEAFTSQTDKKGNIFYHLTHPLPAYADVKVNLLFDTDVLSAPSFWEKLQEHFNHFIFVLCGMILTGYALVTFLYLKYHTANKLPLKELMYYSPISLRYVSNRPLSQEFIETLRSYTKKTKRKILLLSYYDRWSLGSMTKIGIFLNVMRKYLLTMSVIIALTIFQSANTGFPLTIGQISSLIAFMILLNIGLFKIGEKNYINNRMSTLIQNLFQTNIGFGASKASLKALFFRFYPYTLVMDKQNEWVQLMREYGLDITLDYFYKEDK